MSADWETFCDSSYFDLWRVRRKNERGFNDGYHLQNGEEAKALVELLNRVEQERDEGYQKITDLESELRGVGLLRDEAIRQLENIKASSIHTCHDQCQRPMCVLRRERDEAQKELSSIHRWIDKNHADGFIDSLTYLQNLERVADNWYDRLDRLEVDAKRFVRERDEAREKAASWIREWRELRELWRTLDRAVNNLMRERDEARHKLELCMAANSDVARIAKERDEARKHLRDANRGAEINAHINQKFGQQIIDAREQIKELIYIAERAIALAEIDFENDKFGVVSELRDGLERIKEGAK